VGTALGGGAGIGATKYMRGEMESSYAANMDTTWMACQKALKEVGIEINGSIQERPIHWMLQGRAKGGEKVRVTLDALSNKVTRVSVRIGIFGDEQISKKIHDAISRRLG
jgi:hypothetical protein